MNKKRISARLNIYNYDMVKGIADTLFYDENKNKGNLSEALNWILGTFRNRTSYKGMIKFLQHYADYNRGNRNSETVERVRQFLIYQKRIEEAL